MPAPELSQFRENLAFARAMAATATALEAQVAPVMDVSDFFRAALVQGVSAFDHFIHEEVRVRMAALSGRPAHEWPDAFGRFRVSMVSLHQAQAGYGTGWMDAETRLQLGHLAFQQPDKVADATRLVSNVELWGNVGAHMHLRAEDVKRRLKVIVDRRNKIAHEADTDPTPPRARYAIDRLMVDESLDFLEAVVGAIVAVT